ncbi:cell division protein FtsA [Dethiothermospora halolimnae]|uniref:cell division protein FtsA n=1 Tax=Dethiothermospora halolimnae TaxID=3114390 RepID=UPI003CCB84E0
MELDNNLNLENKNIIFSLDIGTRTVIGLVGEYRDDCFKILATEMMEHDKRVMYDGQIHDIKGVVDIVEKVKLKLEEKLEIKLDKVAIAAAGRALKTYKVRVDRDIDITQEISKQIIESLEMEAIQKAQQTLEENKDYNDKYYCVGYTVINYYLDDNFMENLEGHKGNKIGTDVLATFLPNIVVDSLYTVMSKVGLEVINLTLEPIAAINVAIKKNMRLLNLALVDIGAGTSDIAITKDGSIVAYAMASIAGDEITEKISKSYLLDYDSAERLKVELNRQENHKFNDIVGIEHNMNTSEIIGNIGDAIDNLAKEISENIIAYNGKSPSAVFLIGGGSQIPTITSRIAEYLELPEERVVIRDTSIIDDVNGVSEDLEGPNGITPIGIAITALNSKEKDFLEIKVNGKKIKLFNSKEIKVSDALVLVGYNPRKLIPSRGEDFIYYINGETKIKKGSFGEPAKIYVNNKLENLEYKLKNNDIVLIDEAKEGEKIVPKLFECLNMDKSVKLAGTKVNLITDIKVNGNIIKDNITIKEKDRIEVNEIKSVDELFKSQGLDQQDYNVYINDEKINSNILISDGDTIEYYNKSYIRKSNNNTNGKTITLKINGEEKIINYNKKEFIFVDVFDHIDFDLSKPNGILVLKVNGEKAEYVRKLNDGDNLEIYWNK